MQDRLSPRDLAVLRLVAAGLSNREIAAQLGLAPKTVEHMLGSADPYRAIYPKIQVANRAEAAAWYVAHVGEPVGEVLPNASTLQLLDVLSDYEQRIYAVRLAGQPKLAISMADFVIAQATQAAQRVHPAPQATALRLLCLSALEQKGTGLLELAVCGNAVQRIRPVSVALAELAAALQRPDYAGVARAIMAGALNIDQEYGRGLALSREAMALPIGPDLHLRLLRTGVVAALYLHDRASVAAFTQRTRRVIDAGTFARREQVCETEEAVARAQGMMGLDGEADWFDAAEESLQAINFRPLRHLRLLQSKLEVLCACQPTAHDAIERLGQEGIRLADQYGYPRHRNLIVDTLMTALNT